MSEHKRKRAKQPPAYFKLEEGGQGEVEMVLFFDGRRIAKRGKPGTPFYKQWIPLEPGVVVTDGPRVGDEGEIIIEINGTRVH